MIHSIFKASLKKVLAPRDGSCQFYILCQICGCSWTDFRL